VEVTKTIRIPGTFYSDRLDRGLRVPEDIGRSRSHAVVRADDPVLASLLDDAEHYACMGGGGRRNDCMPAGIVASAKATVRAIRNSLGWQSASEEIVRLCRGKGGAR
jgi:hypothetical protein